MYKIGETKGMIKAVTTEMKVVFLSGMFEGNREERQQFIESIKKVIESQNSSMIVDLTSWEEIALLKNDELMDYIKDVASLTSGHAYIRLDQNMSSPLNLITQGFQSKFALNYTSAIPLTNDFQLVLIDTQLIYQNQMNTVALQKKDISNLNSQKKSVFLIDQPFYCSSLADKCTALASVFKTHYQPLMFDIASPPNIYRPLIIAGGADTYERTFPKFDQRHQEYEDPTYFENPEFPTFVNINGLRTVPKDKLWLLQKQQWSAFVRRLQSFGVLTVKEGERSLVYNQYDINGQEIDELKVEQKPTGNHEFDYLAPFIAYPLCIGIALAFLKLVHSTFLEKLKEHALLMQDMIKGVPLSEISPDQIGTCPYQNQANHVDNDSQSSSEEEEQEEEEDDDDTNLSGHRSDRSHSSEEEDENDRQDTGRANTDQPLQEIEIVDLNTTRDTSKIEE